MFLASYFIPRIKKKDELGGGGKKKRRKGIEIERMRMSKKKMNKENVKLLRN